MTLAAGRVLPTRLHVLEQAFLKFCADPGQPLSEVPLTSPGWHCAGHGQVNFSREEKVPAGFLSGASLQTEWVV